LIMLARRRIVAVSQAVRHGDAAGCRMQQHRPPNDCMLVHARARTKTRGNPDRGMRVLLGRGVGLLLGTVLRPTDLSS
jgi:hypothetical protein